VNAGPTTARPRGWLAAATLAALAAVPACSKCSTEPTPKPAATTPKPTDPLLVLDGITITFGDVQSGVDYFDTLQTEVSRRTKMQRVLEEFTLPLLFARREYASQRAQMLERAKAFASVAGNSFEVEERGKDRNGERRTVTPRDVEIPIAQFLFDQSHIGARSEPIELPQGYVVVASFNIDQGGIATADRCDAVQVPFYTHTRAEYREWLRQLQDSLPKKLTYFHPDYRDALPPWLQP
jgi:hypothetical protein